MLAPAAGWIAYRRLRPRPAHAAAPCPSRHAGAAGHARGRDRPLRLPGWRRVAAAADPLRQRGGQRLRGAPALPASPAGGGRPTPSTCRASASPTGPKRIYTPRVMVDAIHAVAAELVRRHGVPVDAVALSLSAEYLARGGDRAGAGLPEPRLHQPHRLRRAALRPRAAGRQPRQAGLARRLRLLPLGACAVRRAGEPAEHALLPGKDLRLQDHRRGAVRIRLPLGPPARRRARAVLLHRRLSVFPPTPQPSTRPCGIRSGWCTASAATSSISATSVPSAGARTGASPACPRAPSRISSGPT